VKLPRDLSGERLVKIPARLGYVVVRSSGSHVRMIHQGPPRNGVTIPMHRALKAGTLDGILTRVAKHLKIDKKSILRS
jgi:predicted RNA binding protein YcfA (HicA-like mRNA interferase family)